MGSQSVSVMERFGMPSHSGRSTGWAPRCFLLFLGGLLAPLSLVWAQSTSSEWVQFPSRDGTVIRALLMRPTVSASTMAAPLTVIALHGCGGLFATSGARVGQLNARHQAMADLLLARGDNVLFPDSLTPRGETQICTQQNRHRRITQTERSADVWGATDWLQYQAFAAHSKLVLLGWSNGGSTVLAATDKQRVEVVAAPQRFALAVAFYPGCEQALKTHYQASIPLVLMLGELDDWTPAAPCITLGEQVGAEVHVFADSYHEFDTPVGQVHLRADVPNGTHPGQGVHLGRNPLARQQAYERLQALLSQVENSP